MAYDRWGARNTLASVSGLAVLGALVTLGVFHNLPFHPVVVAAAALAFALGDEPPAAA